jgi:hypothetical protein
VAAAILDLNRRFPASGDTVTLVLFGPDNLYSTYVETLWLSTLQRTGGLTQDVLYRPTGFNTDPGEIGPILSRIGHPVRLIVMTPTAADQVAALRQQFPQLQLEVDRI